MSPRRTPVQPHRWLVDDDTQPTSTLSGEATESGNIAEKQSQHQPQASSPLPSLPPPSQERLEASLNEQPIDINNLSGLTSPASLEKHETFLYLAYGSNLCKETFRGVRGIKPISQINVIVPTLRLTFDLPGIPYVEPCFANCAIRDPSGSDPEPITDTEYHKDRWHKGMIGCVYEVTASDYAHIIATEGGGASYQDILVSCFPLSSDPNEKVPLHPSNQPFKAHTLFSPAPKSSAPADPSPGLIHTAGRLSRPDPSYAQPSARYLKLITDGAKELDLPAEYQDYLLDIRPYTITSRRQEWGKRLLALFLVPWIMFIFGLQRVFKDKHGRSPKWLVTLLGWFFATTWRSYDAFWKDAFGDGERTEGRGGEEEGMALI